MITIVVIRLSRAGGKASRTPEPGGLTYAQGPHAKCEKISLKIYSKYKTNKHVESLPKVDKFITFQYCDVLRPIDVIF